MLTHRLTAYAQLLFTKEKAARLLERQNDKLVLEQLAKVLSFIECPYAGLNGQKDCNACKTLFEGVNLPCGRKNDFSLP